jgi:hypothetical protein
MKRLERLQSLLTSEALSRGALWYEEAYCEASSLASRFNTTIKRAAAVIAVLSPNVLWDNNIISAEILCSEWAKGCNDASFVRGAGYHKNKTKALNILTGGKIKDNVKGSKVIAFYEGIISQGRTRHVTVDYHMINLWAGKHQTIKEHKTRTHKTFSPKLNKSIQSAIQKIADELQTYPAIIQASLWIAWKEKVEG